MKRTNISIAHQITINNCMAENFTILVMNLPNLEQNLLTSRLWEHLQNYLDKQCALKRDSEIKIIDIKLGYQYTQIKYQMRIAKLSRTLEKLIFKYVRKYDPQNSQLKQEQNVTINHLRTIYDLIDNLEVKAIANIDLQKIIKVKSDLQEFKMKDFEMSLEKNKINFGWKNEQFNKDTVHFHQRVLQIEKTVTPDNINWKNLYYSNTNKIFRKIFSLIISSTILIASFVAVGIIKSVQKFLTVQYPSVNCNTSQFQGISKEDVENIPQGTPQYEKMVKIECFCWLQNYQYKLQSSLYSICNDWYQNYISNLFLPIGIVVSLIIVNFLIQKILTKLSKFEKYKFLNSQMNSQIDKIFVVSFINQVYIIYQTNQKQTPPQYSDSSQENFMQKVFGSGQFYSYNPEWYRNIGIIFIITLISKSLSVPIGKIFFYYYKRFIFFIDQKCSFDKKKTRCKNDQQWLKLRQGPKFSIQYRYAQHLVVLFFMMTFGAGIPLIYLASTLYFVFTFYSDKFLIFKFCRKSRSFDGQMASHFQIILYFSFYFHLISSSNTFLNPQLFYDMYSTYYDKYIMGEVFQVNLNNPYMMAIYSGCFMILVIYLGRLALKVLNLYKLFFKKSNSKSEKKSIIKSNKFYECKLLFILFYKYQLNYFCKTSHGLRAT
ncbi:tRNA (GuanineN(7))methyltransferase, putative (macronuclear) [Tetrahymena thermophila SB210]|uniref:tRNA (GuanineN(7))methyltransferase, putative n=1 Tax=Tetrahymena thermophila (strain SB210) TaxID=312017 RepID=Q23T99_TETTS|nr:tRNA (GuanineN(7))methyltransferase, putative [Tetrahymena thermophila SB210]EAR99807.2 tRNA (GuanineN(7))methyltransferase, putative [Tetrahymena thermophila SB210]|eukprot:XP_001020052.2 tRNA (GuanineN(7))methyltransferase, putative [Tetrahymena thermophila SB210]